MPAFLMLTVIPLVLLVGCSEPQTEAPGNVAYGSVSNGLVLPAPTTPEAKAALAALESGRPWRATLGLAPLLRDSSKRTPDALLIAATAASQWGGWREVVSLLSGVPWLDTEAEGCGRALLARAALEMDDASAAAEHGKLAVSAARNPRLKAERQVILARALDRLNDRDGARDAYLAAANEFPQIADWLRLRAAGVTSDNGQRKQLLDQVSGPVARTRLDITEALGRERSGDLAGAAEKFTDAGSVGQAMRLRVQLATTPDARQAIRVEVLEALQRRNSSTEGRALISVIDSQLAPLSPGEELIVARAAAEYGPATRAADGFARSLAAGLGTGADWARYGDVLFRLGRYDRAATAFARVTGPESLVLRTTYQRGRSLLRAGQGAQATRVLRGIATRHADAAYLLADVADERSAFLDVARRFPESRVASRSLYRAAMATYLAGNKAVAAKEFAALAERYPGSGDRAGALYWTGRALNSPEHWRQVVSVAPMTYYALLAAKRLGEKPWSPDGVPRKANLPAADSALQRATELISLGMDHEARLELDALDDGTTDAAQLVRIAGALAEHGYTARAITVAKRALARGAERDATLLALLYPEPFGEALEAESKARGLDPDLVAALVRQESTFEPRARSPADARGLMQIMPSVGAAVARGLRFPVWDVALLYQPDVNLQLGTAHLAGLLKEYGGRVDYALAAYNAGGSRVRRWRQLPGTNDPEVFVERIPFDETREYVKVVLRGAAYYEARSSDF